MFYIYSDSDTQAFGRACQDVALTPAHHLTLESLNQLTHDHVILELTQSSTLLLDICEELVKIHYEGQLYVLSSALDKRMDTLINKVLTSYGLDAIVLNGREDKTKALYWIFEHSNNTDRPQSAPRDPVADQDEIEELIKQGHLDVHYQAQFQSDSLELVAFEALARLFKDGQPIPLGEVFEVILRRDLWKYLTQSVFDRALIDHHELFCRYPNTNLAINLSAKELSEFSFTNNLRQMLAKSKLTTQRLMFELTENELYSSRSNVSRNLLLIKGCGARLSIDDYGTGLSNAARLTTAPFDEIKLDQSFIKNILNVSENSIAKSTAEIAQTLGMKTVAEGVENQETLDCVRELGIDQVQGFLLHKPQSFEQLMSMDILNIT